MEMLALLIILKEILEPSGTNGVRQQGRNDDSTQGSSLNTRPLPPTEITVQRQRIAEKSYEVVLSWNSGSDAETPDEGLTYSLMIGTSEELKIFSQVGLILMV
jgi:hypothetical protein